MYIRQDLTSEQIKAFQEKIDSLNELTELLSEHNTRCTYAFFLSKERLLTAARAKSALDDLLYDAEQSI